MQHNNIKYNWQNILVCNVTTPYFLSDYSILKVHFPFPCLVNTLLNRLLNQKDWWMQGNIKLLLTFNLSIIIYCTCSIISNNVITKYKVYWFTDFHMEVLLLRAVQYCTCTVFLLHLCRHHTLNYFSTALPPPHLHIGLSLTNNQPVELIWSISGIPRAAVQTPAPPLI